MGWYAPICMSEVVRVSVVGDFHVSLPEGRTASFRTRRAAEVVAKLCLTSSRRLLRADLAADIWPDADRSTRLGNMRTALTYARASLEIPDAIATNEDWLILSNNVDSDWFELGRLETRIQQAGGGDDRLVLLYSLNGLIQKPLLASWDCEWLSDLRTFHDQRRINSFR
jgi:DNA-binding SARP family transcriptional activator